MRYSFFDNLIQVEELGLVCLVVEIFVLFPLKIPGKIVYAVKKIDKLGIAIIVLQWPIWFFMKRITALQSMNANLLVCIYVVIPYLVSIGFHFLVEKPGVKLCQKLFDKIVAKG